MTCSVELSNSPGLMWVATERDNLIQVVMPPQCDVLIAPQKNLLLKDVSFVFKQLTTFLFLRSCLWSLT